MRIPYIRDVEMLKEVIQEIQYKLRIRNSATAELNQFLESWLEKYLKKETGAQEKD